MFRTYRRSPVKIDFTWHLAQAQNPLFGNWRKWDLTWIPDLSPGEAWTKTLLRCWRVDTVASPSSEPFSKAWKLTLQFALLRGSIIYILVWYFCACLVLKKIFYLILSVHISLLNIWHIMVRLKTKLLSKSFEKIAPKVSVLIPHSLL